MVTSQPEPVKILEGCYLTNVKYPLPNLYIIEDSEENASYQSMYISHKICLAYCLSQCKYLAENISVITNPPNVTKFAFSLSNTNTNI